MKARTMSQLGNGGKWNFLINNYFNKKILIISPGFASDCVETLEEISIQGKESFEKSGGENFEFISCLNDNEDHINLLEHLIKKSLS